MFLHRCPVSEFVSQISFRCVKLIECLVHCALVVVCGKDWANCEVNGCLWMWSY
jgi:hypothetical protein